MRGTLLVLSQGRGESACPEHTDPWGLWADSRGEEWSSVEDVGQERSLLQGHRIPPGVL